MTRINLISVEEISDQHLMAEYRELPRIVNGVLDGKLKQENIPNKFCLGKGHVKFFCDKLGFLLKRYEAIYLELRFRKYNLTMSPESLKQKLFEAHYVREKEYIFSHEEIEISKQRLIEKVSQKSNWYKWSKRQKPTYYPSE